MLDFLNYFALLAWIGLGVALNLAIIGYFLIPMYYDYVAARTTKRASDLIEKALDACREEGITTVTLELKGILDAEEAYEEPEQ